jgi:hypothetical protein
VALDAGAIADALRAWKDAGADHVQLAVEPSTSEAFAVVLDGIRAARR